MNLKISLRGRVTLAGLLCSLGCLAPWSLPAGAATPSPQATAQTVTAASRQAFVAGQWQAWYVPQSQAFADSAAALSQALEQHCAGAPKLAAQQRWREALSAWARLSAVSVGPLIQRRSARRIDFVPTRPELIQKAIDMLPAELPASAPAAEAAMQTVGSAARGLPALEWLLWGRPGERLDAAACRYAAFLGRDLLAEASGLKADFSAQAQALSAAQPDATQVAEAFSEALNQWTGGLEQMRLQGLERAQHEADAARLAARPQGGRAASGAGLAERQARWSALRQLASPAAAAAAPRAAADVAVPVLLPYDAFLRRLGHTALANRLAATVRVADKALDEASRGDPALLRTASRRLVELTALVQGDVATTLDIRLGFTDSDGD